MKAVSKKKETKPRNNRPAFICIHQVRAAWTLSSPPQRNTILTMASSDTAQHNTLQSASSSDAVLG